jgi:cytochrome P450 family 4
LLIVRLLKIVSGNGIKGSDTTSSALNGICFLLASNPNVQEKAREEVDRVLYANCINEMEVEVTQESLKNLPYLELVIKESLRLVTPGPFFGRSTGSDVTLGRIN